MQDNAHSTSRLSRLPVLWAVASALLFGITTPLAKILALPPFQMAGLLYLGSGIGLLLVRFARDRGWRAPGFNRAHFKWLSGSILVGGVIAPVCLMIGLARASAASASLLLNFESLFTAITAWVLFREHFTRALVFGMVLVFAGGLTLSGILTGAGTTLDGTAWILLACLGWALDNNLTRPISGYDPLFIAAAKGIVAGAVNLGIAAAMHEPAPSMNLAASASLLGLCGYGISLVFFVRSLSVLGTARTAAYFSLAPFVGASFSLLVLHEPLTASIAGAGLLMATGVALHLLEEHAHEHLHEVVTHTHSHVHDDHHQHSHASGDASSEPHTHEHTHAPLRHRHAHYPDLHHSHFH